MYVVVTIFVSPPAAPFTNMVLTLILAWISNYILYEEWDEPLKFVNG